MSGWPKCPRCNTSLFMRWDVLLRVSYIYCYACSWNQYPEEPDIFLKEVIEEKEKILGEDNGNGRRRILFWKIQCEICQKEYLSRSAKRTVCNRRVCVTEKARRLQKHYRLEALKYKRACA